LKSLRPHFALCILLSFFAFHGFGLFMRFSRDPSTLKNGFMYDHINIQHSLVLRNMARVGGLPLTPEQRWTRLLPRDMPGQSGWELLGAAFQNDADGEVYRNQLPIGYLLHSTFSTWFGVSFWALRFGVLLPFGILMFCVWDMGRRIHSVQAGLLSALIVGLLPCVWQSMILSNLGLSNMAIVALALWGCVCSDRLRHWPYILVSAFATLVSTRVGEYASDGLLCLAAILPVLIFTMGLGAWEIRRDKKIKGMVLGALSLLLAFYCMDWDWLTRHAFGYVSEEASVSKLTFGQILFNFKSYLWIFWTSLLSPVGALLGLIGTASALFQSRKNAPLFILLLSVGGLLIALSIPNKVQDYYLLPIIPALSVGCGVGLAALSRTGIALGVCGVFSLGLIYFQGAHHPSLSGWPWSILDPALNETQPQSSAQRWFADWRLQESVRQGDSRQKMAKWLSNDQIWLQEMSPESVVVIPWSHGSQTHDGLATLIMAYRPDVLLINIDPSQADSLAKDILMHAPEVYWLTFSKDDNRQIRFLPSGYVGKSLANMKELGLSVYLLDD
jgi:hypothetical protein